MVSTISPPERFWPEAEFTRAIEVDRADLWIDAACTFTADRAGLVTLVSARFAGREHSAAQMEALLGVERFVTLESEAAEWWAEEGARQYLEDQAANEADYRYEMRRDEDE